MVNPSKKKGTAAESAVVKFAQANGFPDARRLTLSGSYDQGDVELVHRTLMVEVKSGAQATGASIGQIVKWIHETERERINGEWSDAFLVTQRRGFGLTTAGMWDAHFWPGAIAGVSIELPDRPNDPYSPPFLTVRLRDALHQLRRIGYGDQPDPVHPTY